MSERVGFGVGITAGLLAMGMMFLIRYAVGIPTAPELMQDSIVQLFPGQVASQIIDRLQKSAKLLLFAADGYSDSIPLEKALEPTTLVAYGMNDELLPDSHGAPARLIVPGIYGMKNVKWLTGIEPVEEDFKGFWERRGWSDIAIIKTMSRIDVPDAGMVVPGRNAIGGIAFAGDRGISEVEWNIDDGLWKRAVVKPALSPFSWVLWADEWNPDQPGPVRLKVRAIDGSGAVQTAEIAEPFPEGASGYHEVQVRLP